jgi:hypothetical protein
MISSISYHLAGLALPLKPPLPPLMTPSGASNGKRGKDLVAI